MCKKAVHNYPHALEFAVEIYVTQEMCDKVVKTHSTVIKFVPGYLRLKKCVIKILINIFSQFLYS